MRIFFIALLDNVNKISVFLYNVYIFIFVPHVHVFSYLFTYRTKERKGRSF